MGRFAGQPGQWNECCAHKAWGNAVNVRSDYTSSACGSQCQLVPPQLNGCISQPMATHQLTRWSHFGGTTQTTRTAGRCCTAMRMPRHLLRMGGTTSACTPGPKRAAVMPARIAAHGAAQCACGPAVQNGSSRCEHALCCVQQAAGRRQTHTHPLMVSPATVLEIGFTPMYSVFTSRV